ncbi:MAG: hypothetical protein HYV90_05570 [Candidatus Woesebacteria bacterium]|nr:MAG: hypothetical protein HYV90_05570 [Candidatus Woesebacteria bacterium]
MSKPEPGFITFDELAPQITEAPPPQPEEEELEEEAPVEEEPEEEEELEEKEEPTFKEGDEILFNEKSGFQVVFVVELFNSDEDEIQGPLVVRYPQGIEIVDVDYVESYDESDVIHVKFKKNGHLSDIDFEVDNPVDEDDLNGCSFVVNYATSEPLPLADS